MAPFYFHKGEPSDVGGFLCQWYISPFEAEGMSFNCAEQWMMWNNAKCFDDKATMKEVMKEKNPRKQKQLGRLTERFRDDVWDKHKEEVVFQGSVHKFGQCVTSHNDVNNRPLGSTMDDTNTYPDLRRPLKELLFETEERLLVEASPFDRVWEIGFKADSADMSRSSWGQNLLGKALMRARERLREMDEKQEAPRLAKLERRLNLAANV